MLIDDNNPRQTLEQIGEATDLIAAISIENLTSPGHMGMFRLLGEISQAIRHLDETFGLVWCEHSKYGGVYQVEIGLWSISGPFDDEACFKRSLYNQFARKLMSKAT